MATKPPVQVHHFHPDTGDYLGASDARESPAEPGVYLVPAWATLDAPPAAAAGKARRFLVSGLDVAPQTHHGKKGRWELRDLS